MNKSRWKLNVAIEKRQLADSRKGAFGSDSVQGWRPCTAEPAFVLLTTEHLTCAFLKLMRGFSSVDYDYISLH